MQINHAVAGVREIGFRVCFCLWAILTFAAALYGVHLGYRDAAFATTLTVFTFFLATEILFASRKTQNLIFDYLESRMEGLTAFTWPLFLIVAYIAYLKGTNTFTWWRLGIISAYVLVPEMLTLSWRQTARTLSWTWYVAILSIWVPVVLRSLNSLWPYPNYKLDYVLSVLLAMNVAIVLFLMLHKLDGVGYVFAWGRGWGICVGISFATFCLIEIPLARALGFANFHPTVVTWRQFLLQCLVILLFIAWPEEFIFRGLFQNLLSRSLRSDSLGWVSSSLLFGLAHIVLRGFPNWRYFLIATVAGLIYGRAWLQTRSILVPALVHTLVDATWRTWFGGS